MKKRGSVSDHADLALRSAATARKAGETLNSAAEVIAARANRAVAQTPMQTGVEVNLMVSEKLAAFSEAGAAMAKGAGAMAGRSAAYAEAEAQAAHKAAAAMAACRTPMELFALQSRLMTEFVTRGLAFGLSLNTAATEAGEDALHPIHKTVAANAKRLKR